MLLHEEIKFHRTSLDTTKMKEQAQNIEVFQNFSMGDDGQETADNERNQSICYHYCLQVEQNSKAFIFFFVLQTEYS